MEGKLIESAEDLRLAQTLVNRDKKGNPKCKRCLGKGYYNIQIPLSPLKQLIRGTVVNEVRFCCGKNCSHQAYQLLMKDFPVAKLTGDVETNV